MKNTIQFSETESKILFLLKELDEKNKHCMFLSIKLRKDYFSIAHVLAQLKARGWIESGKSQIKKRVYFNLTEKARIYIHKISQDSTQKILQ